MYCVQNIPSSLKYNCVQTSLFRYTFGVESSFILLQPMLSFAIHNISPDTPHTNWECPHTERDRIRVAYKSNNRGYLIRETVVYPPAHDIVKPLVEGSGNLVEWWAGVGCGVSDDSLASYPGSLEGVERSTPSGEPGDEARVSQEDGEAEWEEVVDMLGQGEEGCQSEEEESKKGR